MDNIKLTAKIKKMLKNLNERMDTQKFLLEENIIDKETYNKEIRNLSDEFIEMINAMYHFNLLTNGDVLFTGNVNIYHIIDAIYYYYCFGENFPWKIK